MTVRARRAKVNPDIMLNIALISLVTSTIAARAFYVIHYWDQFADNPRLIFNLSTGGFEVYGGLIGAFLCNFLYLLVFRLPIRLIADAVAPSILLGMGIGRIGCFLAGCCWGVTCPASLPWAVQFPYASYAFNSQWNNRQVTVPAELIILDPAGMATPIPSQAFRVSPEDLKKVLTKAQENLSAAQASGNEASIKKATRILNKNKIAIDSLLTHYADFGLSPAELNTSFVPHYYSLHVHPSQIYGAIGPILLAFIGNALFYRRKHHGIVMPILFMCYAAQRFIEEATRSDNPIDTFGMTISQGISIAILIIGALSLWVILKLPPRNANVKPWLPPQKPEKPQKKADAIA